jgi:hypothetical protein
MTVIPILFRTTYGQNSIVAIKVLETVLSMSSLGEGRYTLLNIVSYDSLGSC